MPDSRKYTVNVRDAEFTCASRTWADEREQCVEFASKDAHVALRDSKNPSGVLLGSPTGSGPHSPTASPTVSSRSSTDS